MSHRTQDLPPLTGLPRLFRDLRYVEPARQGFAVLLILVYSYVATPLPALAALGLLIAFVGGLVRWYASGFIVKNQKLATDGPYRFVRHPLYSGNILLVVGFGLASSRWWALPLAALFFWFYYPPAIEYEDRKLHGIFGDAWEQWAARTPALVPRFGAIAPAGAEDRRWSIGVSSARNGEIVFLLLCIGCIVWVAWRAFA
jgi:protein-S-isoprenylcysteine O-methyltransferase Ste14